MSNMEQSSSEGFLMNEKIYNTMKSTGVVNLVFGIVTICIGIATGIVMIVNGARLLKHKSEIMF